LRREAYLNGPNAEKKRLTAKRRNISLALKLSFLFAEKKHKTKVTPCQNPLYSFIKKLPKKN